MHRFIELEIILSLEIKDLKLKAATIIEQARSKLNEADGATAERAKEIDAEVDRMFADADALEARATRMAEIEKREAAINAADPRRTAETREIRGEATDGEKRSYDAFTALILRWRRIQAYPRTNAVWLPAPPKRLVSALTAALLFPAL